IARLEGVRVTYDGYISFAFAVNGLEVRRGEILGLIGPRGSGKSTTLKLLAGRLRPNEGKVKVFGRSPRRAAIRRRLGYRPELLALPDAIRILGPVLPAEVAEKALHSIRAELPNASPETKVIALQNNHESKPVGSIQNAEDGDGPKDAVDHEKLKSLTKPAG
ncbi:MAG TPA: ATP-binding cassette domain-containing protein, partial [Verrucomicrobiae bacterium]